MNSEPTDYPASAKIEDRFDEMAKGTFGERLKRERELREVSIDEICSATRIAPKFLEALENEEWEKLPGGVFGRGFVRTIARYLGLSEENLLSEYDLARGEVTSPTSQRPEERIPSTPKWIPATALLVVIVVLLALILGGRYAWRQHVARTAPNKSSAVVSIPSTAETRDLSLGVPPTSLAAESEPNVPLDLSIVASAPTQGASCSGRHSDARRGNFRRREPAFLRD